MSSNNPGKGELGTSLSNTLKISSGNKAVDISFDLSKVKMTSEQQAIVHKLFSQNPIAVIANETHTHENESGMPGPGSKYLNKLEFEKIRTLGARLGPDAVAASIIIDFCVHAIRLQKLEGWQVNESA
jgi:hypothetical protein